jgi:lysophospholipase L1-like esterase/predicted TIM-barrel fold metal-dependent hydrolase
MPFRLLRPLVLTLTSIVVTAASGQDQPAETQSLPLNEFRPVPVLKTSAHPLHHAKFPCVNVHMHPGKLTASQIDETVAVMDEANVAVSVSLDGKAGADFPAHLEALNGTHPQRFVVFVRMDYVGDGNEGEPATWDVHKPDFGTRMADKLSESVRLGASGLKLTKALGLTIRNPDGTLIAPDDPRFDPVWQRAGELGIPVLWHCADPVAFFQPIDGKNERYEELKRHPDWSFYGKDFPAHQELIDARNRVIERHPGTTFICAHFADIPEDLEKLGGYLDRAPNMYVEFAARISELGRQPNAARQFFHTYQDRILFGTDSVPPLSELIPHFQMLETHDDFFPYEDDPIPPQGRWNIYGLGLPDDILRQVYFENASRIIPGVKQALAHYAESHPEAARSIKSGSRSPARWEGDIRQFEEADRAGKTPSGGTLFVGSSSIRLWDLKKSFPGKDYINRGFGGCETSDVVHFANRIVLPYKPKLILLYAGDNDIAAGKSAVEVADDFKAFVRIVHQALPRTRIIYLPIKPSTSRWTQYPRQRAANALVEATCVANPLLEYVDLVSPLFGKDGKPDPALLREDGLHLSERGYALWTERLRPVIEAAQAEGSKPSESDPSR